MRLAAAVGVLKLLENLNYADNLTIDQFLQLSLTIQVRDFYIFITIHYCRNRQHFDLSFFNLTSQNMRMRSGFSREFAKSSQLNSFST